jgi:DNA-binding MarR family transcriptional regulator
MNSTLPVVISYYKNHAIIPTKIRQILHIGPKSMTQNIKKLYKKILRKKWWVF